MKRFDLSFNTGGNNVERRDEQQVYAVYAMYTVLPAGERECGKIDAWSQAPRGK